MLLLSFGSGVAALIYEVVWFQLLELVIGSTAVSLGNAPRYVHGRNVSRQPDTAPSRLRPTPSLARVRADRARYWRSRNPGVAPGAVGGRRLHRLDRIWPERIPAPGSRRGRVPSASDFADGRDAPCFITSDRARQINTARHGVSWLGFFYGANIAGAVLGCLLVWFLLTAQVRRVRGDVRRHGDQPIDGRARTRACRGNSARERSR